MKTLFRKDGKTLKLPYQARNESISARVSQETKDLLKDQAQKHGISLSDLLHRIVIEYIPERLH